MTQVQARFFQPAWRERGLGMIAAIVVLVMLSSLAAAVVRLNAAQQFSSASDAMGANAQQAANAGAEWGLYQALKGAWVGCTNSSQTLDLTATLGHFVTVTCSSNAAAYIEGADSAGVARSVRLYTIDAVACNGASSCPDATRAALGTFAYIERHRKAMATNIDTEH